MRLYQHTQVGYLIIVSLGLVACTVLFGALMFDEWREIFVIGFMAFAILLCTFSTLTVRVTSDTLSIHFGPVAIFKKTWSRKNIRAVRRVRNSLIHGWGIHYTPDGWVYNVSGFDAVEIEKKDGKTFRLGTDDPSGLYNALSQKTS